MMNDYIGEAWVRPKYIAQEIVFILYGRMPQPFKMYYYGTPDERLKDMFGYVKGEPRCR